MSRKQSARSQGSSDNLPTPENAQNRVSNVSLAPLTPEQAITAVFKIKPADVKRIVASKPGNRKKKG
jgi:hypothetical protein